MAPNPENEKSKNPKFEVFSDQASSDPLLLPGRALDGDALGRLRRELTWTLGEIRMAGVLSRAGFSRGRAEAGSTESFEEFMNRFGKFEKKEMVPGQKEFLLTTGTSIEAAEALRFFGGKNKSPQCHFLRGLLSGFTAGRLLENFFFVEARCRAQGESECHFVGKSRDNWGTDAQMTMTYFQEDNMAAELKETREVLKLTRDRYQNMFEQSIVPIFILDPDTGVFLDANLATEILTGYSREEILEKNVFDLFPPEEHHRSANHLKGVAAGEQRKGEETTLQKKDGSRRKIHQSSKIISYGDRNVIQTVMRDITDLKDSEEKEKTLQRQLLRSERLSSIGRLAAGVAHELKNPLGAIRNAVYYVKNALQGQEVLESDPHLKKILLLMESEVDGSVNIIGELLDFSRVVELVPRSTQVNGMLDTIPETLTVPENVQIKMDLDLTLPSAMVDPDRLNQVFRNIAQNAIHSMQENGGILTIRSRLEVASLSSEAGTRELISVSFEDTGKGIESVHLKRIFEPLFTTKARGTGLGLAISNNIVEKHGGVIQVASQVNKGTTFTVKIPRSGPKEKE